jgi:hypothetical protein
VRRIAFAFGTLFGLGLWALLKFIDALVEEFGEEELLGVVRNGGRSALDELVYGPIDWLLELPSEREER